MLRGVLVAVAKLGAIWRWSSYISKCSVSILRIDSLHKVRCAIFLNY